MIRLREVSFKSPDPKGLSDVLEHVFGFTILRSEGSVVILTDGYIQVGITSNGALGDATTLDHIGVQVDDVEGTCHDLEREGWQEAGNTTPATRFYNSPESLQVEIRSPGWGWEDVIRATTQLYQLVPADDRDDCVISLPSIDSGEPQPHIAEAPQPGFVCVARTDDIPKGRTARVVVDDTALAVLEHEGSYYAVADSCPHLPRIGRVSEGQREGRVLQCPIHRSLFDFVDGQVIEPPAQRGLRCYDVLVTDGLVWVKAP